MNCCEALQEEKECSEHVCRFAQRKMENDLMCAWRLLDRRVRLEANQNVCTANKARKWAETTGSKSCSLLFY